MEVCSYAFEAILFAVIELLECAGDGFCVNEIGHAGTALMFIRYQGDHPARLFGYAAVVVRALPESTHVAVQICRMCFYKVETRPPDQ